MEGEQKLTKKERRELAKEVKAKAREKVERSKTLRNWVIGLLFVAGLFYGGYKLVNWIKTPQDSAPVSVELSGNEWSKGNQEAQVILVEYSDFQCPACKSYYPIVKKITEDFGQDVRFVYRHLPLVSIHKNAFSAARAAEAAGAQDKFWEMHDKLFENQDIWVGDASPEDKFEQYADEIGLDVEKFKADYDSDEVKNNINSDLTAANSLRLNSTPSFILNGKKIENPRSFEDFKSMLEDEIRGYSLQ